jgi:hypothetical protein
MHNGVWTRSRPSSCSLPDRLAWRSEHSYNEATVRLQVALTAWRGVHGTQRAKMSSYVGNLAGRVWLPPSHNADSLRVCLTRCIDPTLDCVIGSDVYINRSLKPSAPRDSTEMRSIRRLPASVRASITPRYARVLRWPTGPGSRQLPNAC